MSSREVEVKRELGNVLVESKSKELYFNLIISFLLCFLFFYIMTRFNDFVSFVIPFSIYIIVWGTQGLFSLKKIVIAERGIWTRCVFFPCRREIYLYEEFYKAYNASERYNGRGGYYHVYSLWLIDECNSLVLRIPQEHYSNYRDIKKAVKSKVELSDTVVEYKAFFRRPVEGGYRIID